MYRWKWAVLYEWVSTIHSVLQFPKIDTWEVLLIKVRLKKKIRSMHLSVNSCITRKLHQVTLKKFISCCIILNIKHWKIMNFVQWAKPLDLKIIYSNSLLHNKIVSWGKLWWANFFNRLGKSRLFLPWALRRRSEEKRVIFDFCKKHSPFYI